MIYNPFEILQISAEASEQEITDAYNALKSKYRDQRFEPGARGEEAAEKLEQLDNAYSDALHFSQTKYRTQTSATGAESYAEIKEAINKGEYEKAQNALDNCSTRDGEWHYVQSKLFYVQHWLLEARKQLELCCQFEPDNARYTKALEALNKEIASNTVSPDQLRSSSKPAGGGAYTGPYDNGTCTGSCCGDMCVANLCANCLCGGCR